MTTLEKDNANNTNRTLCSTCVESTKTCIRVVIFEADRPSFSHDRSRINECRKRIFFLFIS